MQPQVEKREAFQMAQDLLSRGDVDSLRYAALEFRRCLEAVVYEKLWAYRDRIPADVARKWQPPQAFRALLLLEPDAARTATYRFAEETEYGVAAPGPYTTLGTDVRPSTSWLTRTYNKLGSFLHAMWPFGRSQDPPALEATRAYLAQVAEELRPFVERNFTAIFGSYAEFSCSQCGFTIRANANGLEHAGEIECLNPDCACRYTAQRDGVDFVFTLDAQRLDCPQCSSSIVLPSHKLRLGYEFSCPKLPPRVQSHRAEVWLCPEGQ